MRYTFSPDVLALNPQLAQPAKRQTKYRNVPTEFDGIKFASKAEMARYGELRLLEMSGQISDLECQPVFVLTAGVKYYADFRYVEDGKTVAEDVKGGKATQTRVFLNKWRQVKVLYPDVEFRLIEK